MFADIQELTNRIREGVQKSKPTTQQFSYIEYATDPEQRTLCTCAVGASLLIEIGATELDVMSTLGQRFSGSGTQATLMKYVVDLSIDPELPEDVSRETELLVQRGYALLRQSYKFDDRIQLGSAIYVLNDEVNLLEGEDRRIFAASVIDALNTYTTCIEPDSSAIPF